MELELAYKDRTLPIFLLLAFGVVIFLFLTKSVNYKLLSIIATLIVIGAVYLFKRKSNSTSASEIVEQHTIGKLSVYQDPFEIRDESQNIIIGADFNGSISMKCEGYYKEVVGTDEDYVTYYGSSNQILIKGLQKEKKFIVYLKNQEEKKKFQQLTEILHSKNIEVKEFTRGERTYLGKKLNYKEIQAFKQQRNK